MLKLAVDSNFAGRSAVQPTKTQHLLLIVWRLVPTLDLLPALHSHAATKELNESGFGIICTAGRTWRGPVPVRLLPSKPHKP